MNKQPLNQALQDLALTLIGMFFGFAIAVAWLS